MQTSFGSLIVSFFRNYLTNQKGASPNTITSYSDCIRLLIGYCCERRNQHVERMTIESITDEVVLDFLDFLEQERGNLPITRNQRLQAIKTFFRFLARQQPDLVAVCERVCAISDKATEHKVIGTLAQDEVDAVVDATDPTTLNGARDRVLTMLLADTGARVQELVDLQISDLRLQQPAQVLITGKGRKQRIVPLDEDIVQAIQHYLEFRDAAGIRSEHLLLNARKQPITRFGINYLTNKYVRIAEQRCPSLGGRTVTPHVFRHTKALHLIQAGVDIFEVKEWLGHADIKTTMQYCEINLEMKRAALAKCPPHNVQAIPEQPQWDTPEIMRFLNDLSSCAALC